MFAKSILNGVWNFTDSDFDISTYCIKKKQSRWVDLVKLVWHWIKALSRTVELLFKICIVTALALYVSPGYFAFMCTLQVNFSEPLSFLQRLTEDFEYAECLNKAATCTDSCEQLAYVAAFTISSYANTTARTGKPFNPLLGETFECDRREDLGWRSFAEQVRHVSDFSLQY